MNNINKAFVDFFFEHSQKSQYPPIDDVETACSAKGKVMTMKGKVTIGAIALLIIAAIGVAVLYGKFPHAAQMLNQKIATGFNHAATWMRGHALATGLISGGIALGVVVGAIWKKWGPRAGIRFGWSLNPDIYGTKHKEEQEIGEPANFRKVPLKEENGKLVADKQKRLAPNPGNESWGTPLFTDPRNSQTLGVEGTETKAFDLDE